MASDKRMQTKEKILLALVEERSMCVDPDEHPHAESVLKSLAAAGLAVFVATEECSHIPTREGAQIVCGTSAEYALYERIADAAQRGTPLAVSAAREDRQAWAIANRLKWLALSPDGTVRPGREATDETKELLQNIASLSRDQIKYLKGRKLIVPLKKRLFLVHRGPNSLWKNPDVSPADLLGAAAVRGAEIRYDAIADAAAHVHELKSYNFSSLGIAPKTGALHPLCSLREECRKVFVSLGFSEMDTGRYVESSFWNFDSLFQPQNHSARDAQDTFFVACPRTAQIGDAEYLGRVKAVHETGGYGSAGHRNPWSIDTARTNVLRTHTTACSARELFRRVGTAPFRLFSIDRVFRNEAVDATHMPEFHQIEGVIADRNLRFCNLTAIFRTFFTRLGFRDLRFRPTYNPYTEPSVEIYARHPVLDRWIEIGNSGFFRPEMLGPMGYPEDISVVGFGLSLERPAMIRHGVADIREFFGTKSSLSFVRSTKIDML